MPGLRLLVATVGNRACVEGFGFVNRLVGDGPPPICIDFLPLILVAAPGGDDEPLEGNFRCMLGTSGPEKNFFTLTGEAVFISVSEPSIAAFHIIMGSGPDL